MDEQNGAIEPLADDEVALIPVDRDQGLVLALAKEPPAGDLIPTGLLDSALDKAGLAGGAFASMALLDGSLVRLAPETVGRLKEGAVFLRDSQGFALGSLREVGKRGVTDAVRFLPGAANPVAAGLMLQTMAVQRQLGQIQEALEAIDRKLDTLIKGTQHERLARLQVLGGRIDELWRKFSSGHALTSVDETKLHDYRDEAEKLQKEAVQWLASVRQMLSQDEISLKQQHKTLTKLVDDEHVGFWVRVYIASELALAHSRWLELAQAAVNQPDFAKDLEGRVRSQLEGAAKSIAGLTSDLDAYLRNPDIADGWENLSLKRKREVRARRRELLDVHAGLREGVEASHVSLEQMLRSEVVIPDPLTRRQVDPWLLRDGAYDGAKAGAKALKSGAKDAQRKTIEGGLGFFRRLEEKHLTEEADSGPAHDQESGRDE
jgi:hypothetical protein